MEWMILPLKRYADFTGRSRRMEFWMFMLFYWIVTIVLFMLIFTGLPWGDIMAGKDSASPDLGIGLFLGMGLFLIWWLATLIPSLAVTVRRLHDRGLSGWWYAGLLIANFVPLLNLLVFPGYLVLLVFLCLPSEERANKWGPSPFDPGQASVFE